MRLNTKLAFNFALIAILIAIAGAFGSYQLQNLATAYYIENEQLLPALSSLSDMKRALPIIELEPLEYIQKPDPEHPEELEEAEEQMNQALQNYEKVAGQTRTASMKQDIDELFDQSMEIIALRDSNSPPEILDQRFEELDDRIDEFHDMLDSEGARLTNELTLSTDSLKNTIQSTLYLTIVLATIAAGIAIVNTAYFSQTVSKPIAKLKEAADQIRKGNYDVDTLVSKSNDEIGELCIHFGKMKDELKHKEKMQEDFVSIASHELRTPVQPILAYTELYEKGMVKAEDAIHSISKEAKRLQRLTSDILDVTRIQSGRLSYSMEKIVLRDLITDIAEASRLLINNNEIQLIAEFNLPDGLEIYADEVRIRQSLFNVIGNAVKFTGSGKITIQSEYTPNKGLVEIAVIDSGPGIPSEVLPILFGKFVTKDVSIENHQGTGLGLFISKAIIEAHGGTITAENNENQSGATFRIQLPVHLGSSKNSLGINEAATS